MAVFSYTGIVCVFLIFCYCSELFGHSVGSSVRECERISPFYGGEVTYINDTEGRSNAFYSCEDAYSLFPSDIDFSNCTKRRKWKPEPPKCLRKAEVEIPDHGKVCKGKSDIILHSESYAVCCDKGYELYNDIYLEKKRVHIKNNNGSLEPNIPECKEARCDPSDQNMANVQYLNGSNTMTKFPSRTVVLLSCKDGYDYYRGDRPMTTPLLRTCVKGSILKAPKCKEARCLFSGYPSNKDTYQRVYLGDAQLVFDDQYIEPRQKIEVFCHKSRQYELFVNSTETHLEEFISECKHGQFDHKKEEFPTCVERRCSVSVSSEVCFWMDDREHCKANNFSIPSRSSVHMRCRDGYKLSRSEDGRSVEVDGDALIMCNKGAYDESYRCISEPCAVPEVKHSKLISKDASSYEHGENITFACDTGFHFYQNISTKINAFETTCNLVQWTDDIPSGCKPDGCKLDLLEGSKYYSADKTVEIANATLIKHTTSIRMQCRGMFDLFNENNNIFRDKEYMPAVICYQGKWRNQHFCKKRCGTLNITNGKLIKDGRNVTEGETIAHGESVYVKNNNKKADSDLPADSAMKCHDGEWQNFVGVSSSSSTPATTTEIITTIAIDSTTISEADKQSRGKDVLPEKKHIQNTRNKGCTLPDDQRYTYTDFDDNNKDPGSFISDGTTLTVGCTTLDLYDFYTSSYDYDYNSTSTITCMKNTLSQLELDCPEVTPNTCKELQHGSVNEKNGYFIVSCDEGYSLDLIVPERPQCTCENGQLKSVFGGQAPACIPDKCVIPYEFDVRLSVTDRRRVSLSGGSVVEVGDFVYFNCSKAGESKYEPLNRRFKCVNGLWKEAERDRNWKLGYNGEFPSCRAAICEPNCTNGGVCFKDDNCRCKHLTEGKRCEKFICDDTCFGNGGECTGPGRCSCPAERFGLNCEQKGCILPKNAANYTGQRIASPGTTLNNFACDRGYVLSSQNGMMCRDGGSWSQIVTCIKGCTLPNHAANNKDRETTFSPGQTLNNFACQPGYVLSSENGMTCQRGGSWSEIVTCIKGCTLPNHAANHKDRGTTFSPGEILNNFACRPGYVLSSENGMTCRHGGSWSEIVTCIKGCTLPNHAGSHKDRRAIFSPRETYYNFYCEHGYVLSSKKGMTCQHGGSGCTLPNQAGNHKDRRAIFSLGETYYYNFYCQHGYVLSSKKGITCQHGGSGCTLPNHAGNHKDRRATFNPGETYYNFYCEHGCTLPNHAANHKDRETTFSPGQTLNNFACQPGYVLSSEKGMKCQRGGSWSEIVTCIKGCTLPNHAANHKDRGTTFSPGEILNNFACRPGYVLSSENGMTCRHGGSWSEIVTCTKGCTLPNHAGSHKDRRAIFSPRETYYNFYCEHGYVLSSKKGMICQHGGSGCTLPNHAANNKDRGKTFSHGETLNNFACQPGYVLSSEKGMTCQRGGSWSEIVTCIKANHKDRGTTFSPGETLNNFPCGPGYVLSSEKGMTRQNGGTWSEIVTCIKGCTLPNQVTDSKDSRTIFSPGETFYSITCQPGYVLSSQNGMKCQHDGSWSEILTCSKVQQMECWFDAGHKWYPKWNEIEYYCGHKQHSVKECQDSCLNQKKIPLKSVFHNPYHGSCCCLAVSAKSDFVAKRNQWNSLVYILSCK